MVLMALDHTRDFFSDAVGFDPCDPTRTTVALFFTRWVTHFCAPIFVFLAGTGAFLSLSRGKTKGDLSRFLLSRGLWLVILDPTVIQHSWIWDLNFRFAFGQVIGATGWSMIALAGLIHLPRWLNAFFAVGMIAAHNLFDGYAPAADSIWGMVWAVLHIQRLIKPVQEFEFFVVYPLIPWIGVLAAGFAFGPLLLPNAAQRRVRLLALGLSMTAAFVVLRWMNVYGDPAPWSTQNNVAFTFLSFLNATKYPPSLLFLLMTLGPGIVLLALLDGPPGMIGRWLTTFGRIPMFFYLLHVPFIHVLVMPPNVFRYGWSALGITVMNVPPAYGFPLPVVFGVWLGVVTALYFPCRWFAAVKQRRRDWWLSYL